MARLIAESAELWDHCGADQSRLGCLSMITMGVFDSALMKWLQPQSGSSQLGNARWEEIIAYVIHSGQPEVQAKLRDFVDHTVPRAGVVGTSVADVTSVSSGSQEVPDECLIPSSK